MAKWNQHCVSYLLWCDANVHNCNHSYQSYWYQTANKGLSCGLVMCVHEGCSSIYMCECFKPQSYAGRDTRSLSYSNIYRESECTQLQSLIPIILLPDCDRWVVLWHGDVCTWGLQLDTYMCGCFKQLERERRETISFLSYTERIYTTGITYPNHMATILRSKGELGYNVDPPH